MEAQGNLMQIKVGNEEAISLKPAIVKIVEVEVQEIEIKGKKNKKVACKVKHPDTEQLIQISSAKFESKGKLETVGLWLNLDSKGLIRKGSALAILLNSLKAENIESLRGKEVPTILDDKNYLTFKSY